MVVDPNWVALSAAGSLRGPFLGAYRVAPGAAAFPDVAVQIAIVVEVPSGAPFADAVAPADVACAGVAGRAVLQVHRDLAYDAGVGDLRALAVVADRSCEEVHAGVVEVRADSVVEGRVAGVVPASTCDHPGLLGVGLEARVDAQEDLVPYAADPEVGPVVVGTGCAVRGKALDSATVAPLDSVLGAEA